MLAETILTKEHRMSTTTATEIIGVDIFGPATRDAKRLFEFYR